MDDIRAFKALVRKKLCYLFFVLAPYLLQAQPADRISATLGELTVTDQFPEELLTSRSAVLIQVPLKQKGSYDIREEWHPIAEQAHPRLRDAGIDAVAYINISDVFSGYDAIRGYAEMFSQREIKQFIIIDEDDRRGRSHFTVTVTKYNGNPSLITPGQEAFQLSGADLRAILGELYRRLALSDLEYSNYLILEVPEYFDQIDLVRGKRYPSTSPDLKVDKLAIPIVGNEVYTVSTQPTPEKSEEQIELEKIMSIYPFKYGFVDYRFNEKELLDQGYQWLLLRLHTTGRQAKDFLEIPYDPEEPDFLTVRATMDTVNLVDLPATTPVYKYYVKHIYTGDVYIGEKWDADIRWQDALLSYWMHFRRQLIKQ